MALVSDLRMDSALQFKIKPIKVKGEKESDKKVRI